MRSLFAKSSGIENPTKEDLAKLDRKRNNKGSNDDWGSSSDPDSGIAKMKDCSMHLAHKAEHTVNRDSGAVVAVDLTPGHTGDTTSYAGTVIAADENLKAVHEKSAQIPEQVKNVIADKSYHGNQVSKDCQGSRDK